MKPRKKQLDFELNLLPFISVLAVCISFLMLTAVWEHVGSFSLSQAFGTEGAGAKKNPPALWVQFGSDGTVQVSVKEGDQLRESLRFKQLRPVNAKPDLRGIEKFAKKVKSEAPQLNIALLLPAAQSSYEDMITVMDALKQIQIRDIGIAPL